MASKTSADSRLARFFPIISWLSSYSKDDFTGDLFAGLTVGVMLVPQGMAYAMLAGLPAIYGLYASTIPLMIYALLGTSRQLSVAPVAMVSLLTASAIASISVTDPQMYLSYAVALALMVGVFQLALGLFKQGFLINFLSRPVISGYTSAAALIIGLNQLKHLLKIDLPQTNQMYILLGAAGQQLANTHMLTLLIGLCGIILILVLRKVNKSIPGPLIMITLGILTIYYFQLDTRGVSIIQNVPPGLPSFQLPHVSWEMIQAMIPFALTIALVGFMESNAIANRIAARHKSYRLDTNQELVALGASNVFSSLIQGFPISGGFSRTAVNDQAGAKTPMASVFSALLVILTLAFFTPLFYYLPKALLASLIIVAVIGLIDVHEAKRLWKVDQKDFAMLVVTFAATLLTGVQYGIAIGVGLSLAIVLFKSAYPHVAIEGKLPTTELFRNIKRFPEAVEIPKVLIMRFDAQLFFGNMRFFKETIEGELDKRPETRLVIINGQSINSIDSSGIYMLKELVEELQKESIDVAFVELKGPIRDIMVKNKLVSSLGSHHFFNETKDAINQFDGSVLRSSSDNSFQSNIEV